MSVVRRFSHFKKLILTPGGKRVGFLPGGSPPPSPGPSGGTGPWPECTPDWGGPPHPAREQEDTLLDRHLQQTDRQVLKH